MSTNGNQGRQPNALWEVHEHVMANELDVEDFMINKTQEYLISQNYIIQQKMVHWFAEKMPM